MPREVLDWMARIAAEVGRAPLTLYKVRNVMDALASLPDQIDELIAALDNTTTVLESSLPKVEDHLDDLRSTFDGVDGRIQNLESTVVDFSANVRKLIAAIPGARRTLRN